MDKTSNDSDEQVCLADMSFTCDWVHVSSVRKMIEQFLAIPLQDDKMIQMIVMAASELMENSIKFSDRKLVSIKLRLDASRRKLLVSFENHTGEENVQKIREILNQISDTPTPKTYRKMVRRSLTLGENESQLGLVRIRHEAGADISMDYHDGVVTIKTEFSI